MNFDHVARGGNYKWFFSTSIDPKLHDILINERKEKGKWE